MINNYDIKMFIIYIKKFILSVSEKLRITKWNWWQKLNNKYLYTYPLIKDCARCRDCGRNVHDFIVPDELWKEIIGNEKGVWCYDCFCNRADEKLKFKWRINLIEKGIIIK